MINKQWLESNGYTMQFNWTDLHGMELKIHVAQDIDNIAKEMTTVVSGFDAYTGDWYVLHTETKRI